MRSLLLEKSLEMPIKRPASNKVFQMTKPTIPSPLARCQRRVRRVKVLRIPLSSRAPSLPNDQARKTRRSGARPNRTRASRQKSRVLLSNHYQLLYCKSYCRHGIYMYICLVKFTDLVSLICLCLTAHDIRFRDSV